MSEESHESTDASTVPFTDDQLEAIRSDLRHCDSARRAAAVELNRRKGLGQSLEAFDLGKAVAQCIRDAFHQAYGSPLRLTVDGETVAILLPPDSESPVYLTGDDS